MEASEACRGLSTQEDRHGAAAAAAAAATEWQAGGCEAGGGAVSRALALGGDAWWEVSASRRACGCAGHASSSLSPLAPEAEGSGGRQPAGAGGGAPCEALARRPWMRQRRGQEVAVEVDTAASAEAVAGGESLVCTGRVASGCYTRRGKHAAPDQRGLVRGGRLGSTAGEYRLVCDGSVVAVSMRCVSRRRGPR